VNDLSKAPSSSIQNLNENESFYGTLCHSGPFIITDLRAQIYNTAPDMMYSSIFVLRGILGSSHFVKEEKYPATSFLRKKMKRTVGIAYCPFSCTSHSCRHLQCGARISAPIGHRQPLLPLRPPLP
jgi:hypothetical protein